MLYFYLKLRRVLIKVKLSLCQRITLWRHVRAALALSSYSMEGWTGHRADLIC
jgi:hypothetical protein